jgi:MFS family permease
VELNPIVEECAPAAFGHRIGSAADSARRDHDRALRGDLRSIIGDGAACSIMVGIGESYLAAFVLAMGMGQVAAGLVSTIPLVVGALLQLISPVAVRRLGSHRRWVVVCATTQALSFAPLCIAALAGSMSVWAMFAVAAVYWGAGMGSSAAWNTWVDTLVPRRIRAHYFARRTRISQIATLVGFLIGGIALQLGAWADRRLWAFACLFLVAAICRCSSAALLAGQSEPPPRLDGHRRVSMSEFFRRFRTAGDGRLLFYLLSVQTAAQISGPYFTSYMLGPMRLSYASYVTLIAISFAAKALSLPALGRFAHHFGTRKLLWLGGLGIVPISGLWAISNDFSYLVVVQTFSGIAWAAYELAMFLLFFETIRPEERTSVLTTFNFAHAVATASGSLLGGALLAFGGKSPQAYLLLFVLSSAARAVTLVGLARVPNCSPSRDWPHERRVQLRPGAPMELPTLPAVATERRAA